MKWRTPELITSILRRVIIYGALLGLLALSAHVYLSYPLYIKKLPYFSSALRAGFSIQCDAAAPLELRSMLRRVSLPFFSLTGQVLLVDSDGQVAACQVGDKAATEAFRFASMTKVLTAFAVLDLVQQGKVDLHKPVLHYFPEVNPTRLTDPNVANITLWHLLNHSSGLGGPFGSDKMDRPGETPWCPYQISALEGVRLAGAPGSNHLYSNVAYCLAGEVITRTVGVDYQTYMEQTYLHAYPSLRFVHGDYEPSEPEYDLSNDWNFDRDYVHKLDFHALAPAAGLMGRADEFALLVQSLLERNPEIMYAEPIEVCGPGHGQRCYSYTFQIIESEQGRVALQGGYLPGASSLVAINKQGEVLVWTAAGAALEGKHRQAMTNRVVAFLTERGNP